MARGLKFRIYEVEGLYYLCSENKGADQLRGWASLWENRSSGFPTRYDTNLAVQIQKMTRGLKFRIYEIQGLYYICSENKAADQLCGYREADLRLFSHMQKADFLTTRLFHNIRLYNLAHGIWAQNVILLSSNVLIKVWTQRLRKIILLSGLSKRKQLFAIFDTYF